MSATVIVIVTLTVRAIVIVTVTVRVIVIVTVTIRAIVVVTVTVTVTQMRDEDLVYKTIAVSKHHKPWLVVNVGSGVSMLKLDEQVPQKEPCYAN